MARGCFISFEGNEGCGKSTQVTRLRETLEKQGRRVVVTREPGGTPIGEEIRKLLQYSPIGHGMCPETELLLFAASRAQLVREVIQPALDRGEVVVADRFLDSTTVYQGAARQLNSEQVARINDFAVGGLLPQATILIDIDVEMGRKRMKQRKNGIAHDRMEAEDISFYEAVRQGYLELARGQPERVALFRGDQPEEDLAGAIWNHLQERCHGLLG